MLQNIKENEKFNKGFTLLNNRKANLTGFTLLEAVIVTFIVKMLTLTLKRI